MKKSIIVVFCLVFTLLYPEAGTQVATKSTSLYGIGWFYIHHIVQMVLASGTIFLFVFLFNQKPLSKWGFNFNNHKWSVSTALKFAAGWLLITVVLNLLFTFDNHITYEKNLLNISTDLFFDFVVTPFSEEILFRGLIMGLLLIYLPSKLRTGKLTVSWAAIISTLLFSLAHIGIDYQNLTIDHIDAMQLAFTTGLGLFYAIMREKSGSLLGPVIAHGFSDGIITVVQLIL